MLLQDTYTLNNGVQIPKLGLGTWMISDDSVDAAVRAAVGMGYRHIDTAQAYENEAGVGRGIQSCGVPREQLFITTKLAAELKDHASATAAIDGSLAALGLDRIDLMLIHSPQPWMEYGSPDRYTEGNRAAWRALEEAHMAGKLGAIGVSNFTAADLDSLMQTATVRPAVNQVLAHIGQVPTEMLAYAKAHDILVQAYSPIAHGELLQHTPVQEMAERYSVSVPQLSIRYLLQLGLLPLPKTGNPEHMAQNAAVDFEISAEDMQLLAGTPKLQDYGEASVFPVFGGRLN